MQFNARRRRSAPSIIIVSLIDVLLVVLIFLMVSTTFKKQSMVKVQLPTYAQAKEGTGEGPPPFVITIAKDPPYLQLESGPVTTDRLRQILADKVAKDPNLAVAIRGDGKATLQQVLSVWEILKQFNIKQSPGIYAIPEGKK